jgi:hypothetical protein
MKKLLVVLLAAAAMLAYADETHVQKVVPVKSGDAAQIFTTARDVLQTLTLKMTMYQNNIVLSGSADAVAAAEQLIKNLEASSPVDRDVEISGYIILAAMQPDGTGGIPADLEPVLKQFRNLLNYKSFRVVDTIILRTREANVAATSGFFNLPNDTHGASEDFSLERATIAGDVIHLKNLKLRLGIPTPVSPGAPQFEYRNIHLQTDVDIKAGQKVAIGKASIDPAGDAIILVVSAKVVD